MNENQVNDRPNLHVARTAMNRDSKIREWIEDWLKSKERGQVPELSSEQFETRWRYVKPERMHEGALDAYMAFLNSLERH